MSSHDLEKKERSPSSSNQGLANKDQVAYGEPIGPQEETLHRALKARQVSRSYTFHSLDLGLS